MSATGVVAAIATGETSARAEAEAAIARIEALDGAINAVVVRDFDRALAAADAADVRVAAGEHLPLLGLPMTVKESFDVAGLPTTWGFTEHAGHKATVDAAVVQRLKAAGAVILGKTNVPVSLADWQSVNPVYGRTNNPHDITRSPGGSSGGSAAALTSGMVALEYGSDIGGSIRVPAHFCGVWGHKPSYALVPTDGHFFPGTEGARAVMAVAGPLATDALDLELALDVTMGHPVPASHIETLARARILVLGRHPVAPLGRGIASILDRAASVASDAGAHVATSGPLPDLAAMNEAYMRLLLIAIARGVPMSGQPALPLTTWFDMLDEQARYRRQWMRLFADFDAVLAPVAGIAAFTHDDTPMAERVATIDGSATPFGAQLAWAGLANYTELPATAFPAGQTSDGLPVGLQVIGPCWGDKTSLRIARLLHAALGGNKADS